MKIRKFNEIARILELKTEYEEYVEEFYIPSNRTTLNIENAKWFLEVAGHLNYGSNKFDKTEQICKNYLEMAA